MSTHATFWLIMFSVACSAEEAAGPVAPARGTREGSAVLAENTKILDDAGARALASFEEQGDAFDVTFSRSSEVLEELAAGDVLVVGVTRQTPNGALLAVDEVGNDGRTLRAHRASLSEAFEELELQLDVPLALGPELTTAESLPGAASLGRVQQAVGVSLAFELGAGSGSDRLDLQGSLALDAEAQLKLDLDISRFELEELSLRFSARETFAATLEGRGEATYDAPPVTLARLPLEPIIILIPLPTGLPLPVVLTPNIALEVGLKAAISGEVQVGVTQRASFEAGLGYIDGEFRAFSDDDSDFDTDDPTFGSSATVRAWAGPKLEVSIYGAVGPFASVQGFVEASASAEGEPLCVTGAIDAGLSATAGVSFIADYSTSLFDRRYRLAGFDSCDPELDAPDAATTWARTYGRVGSPGDRAQAVVQVSDGGYFVVGETASFDGVTGFAAATWALRLDPLGNVVWQRAYARTSQGLARAAAEAPGGFLIAGDTGVLSVDTGGNVRWAKQYSTEGGIEITSLAARSDGRVVLSGVLGLAGRAFAMQLDEQGDVAWAQSFPGADFRRVRTTRDGGSVLAGRYDGESSDFYVAKLDASGGVEWQRSLDNRYDALLGVEDAQPNIVSSGDSAYDVVEKLEGGFVVVGESYGNFPIPEAASGGYYANAVLELDASGALTTSTVSRAPDEALYGAAYAALVRANGSTLVVARGAAEADDLLVNEDVLLIQDGAFARLDGGGNDYVYSSTLPGLGRGMPLSQTADGGAILAVTSDSFTGYEQVWLLKLSRTGSIASPFRSGVSGSSYVNPEATSFALRSPAADIDVQVQTFTGSVLTESTEVVVEQQTP